MLQTVYLIPLIPFVVSLIILLGGKEDPRSPLPYLGIIAMFWCLVQSCCIFAFAACGTYHLPYEMNVRWFSLAADIGGKPFSFSMPVGVLIDGSASLMLVIVSLVSFLVHLYSLGYMHGDARFKRFYAYLSFFTASMLGLVVSSNLLVTFMCWELVGVSSYLLIGFWFEKPEAAYAAKKAFITTKLGDLGLYLALLAIFAQVGSFQIAQIQEFAAKGYLSQTWAFLIGLGILCGAAGKSAQWPLFIWLPDAMEGPTPVSALIHAATMVAAGIYLVARSWFIYQASPIALETVAWIGLITAFLAATMAVVSYDIKRVLAFSTISQLGYMMCALGVGAWSAGMFHLTTHAFFKALLFLCAGSVIHAVHTNDMREMGGLSKKMPITFITMGVAALAISGIPPFSGYYSKDFIIERVYAHNAAMGILLIIAAASTAFYMFRLLFLTFAGSARDSDKYHHAHESPKVMTVPLVALALLSVISGFALSYHHFIENFLASYPALAEANVPAGLGIWVLALVVFSIWGAWKLYRGPDFAAAESLKRKFLPAFNLLERRYGFDAVFLTLVDWSDAAAKAAYRFDSGVIDRIFVDGWGLVFQIFSEVSHLFDAVVVDRTVDGFGGLGEDLGAGLRSLVSEGQIQTYLLYIAFAVSLLAVLMGR